MPGTIPPEIKTGGKVKLFLHRRSKYGFYFRLLTGKTGLPGLAHPFPVSGNPHPAAGPFGPVTGHPRVSPPRLYPAAGHPHVASMFPLPVPRNPDSRFKRRRRPDFHPHLWRRFTHIDGAAGAVGGKSHYKNEQQHQYPISHKFLHLSSSLVNHLPVINANVVPAFKYDAKQKWFFFCADIKHDDTPRIIII